MLAQRIRQALGVLGGDETVRGTLREQASAYLGEHVDDAALTYMHQTAAILYKEVGERAKTAGYSQQAGHDIGLTNVLLGGMAIGKRLGIEDGERFANLMAKGTTE